MARLIKDTPVPVVISPSRELCIIDHHHFVFACWHADVKEVRVKVVKDLSHSKLRYREFWQMMAQKRYDYLNLPNGKKIQVPFDQLIVFSTNLEPRDLVDEAFLRRIPYKIEVVNPSEEEFSSLFKYMCPKLGFEYDEAALNYLIETHYKARNRPFRACQPRDLLTQVKNHCFYQKLTPQMSPEYFDIAVENYFAVM